MIIVVLWFVGPYKERRTGKEDPLYGRQKPDFSAPGVKIYSAYSKTNDSYTLMSGTSMATPHVSGVIALIMSARDRSSPTKPVSSSFVNQANPEIIPTASSSSEDTYDTIYRILKESAKQSMLGHPIGGGGARIPLPGWPKLEQCDAKGDQTFPNMFYGWGLVDALDAVNLARVH